jgi:hypothetical protein
MEMLKRDHYFFMFSRIGFCIGLKIFLIFVSGQWDCWIWYIIEGILIFFLFFYSPLSHTWGK